MAKKTKEPETKVINGQQAVRVDSNLANWPGYVYVPRELTPEQFCAWWEKAKGADESKPKEILHYESRFHLILEWNIDGFNPTPHGDKVPAAVLWRFVEDATAQLIMDVLSLPNLRRPSSAITSTTARKNGNG